MNQKPIFLLGAHKSGTSLLRSILDGHSQLYAIPIESHYFQNIKYWVNYEYRSQKPQRMSTKEIINNFCKWIHKCNISTDQYGDSIAKGLFDEFKFKEIFSTIKPTDNDKELIEKYLEAIYFSLNETQISNKIRIVEKSVENAEFAVDLNHLFPQAKFIHIIRNPYANIVSLRKYKSINYGFPLMPRILKSLYNSFYYLYKNQRVIKNYFTIRYEDLVLNPEKSVKSIGDFLAIEFENILLTPTTQSKLWHGNSTTGQVFHGIVSSNLDKWKSEIHQMEVKYINKLFPFMLEDYGYEVYQHDGSWWKRAKGENIKRYIYNRVYNFYL